MYLIAITTGLLLLTGCDMLGVESGTALAARREAEGKAIGGACRHAGRAIEDCYALNRKGDKAAMFAGWREMNDYMRENKIEAVSPQVAAPTEVAAKATDAPAHETGAKPSKTSDRSESKKSHAS